MNDDEKEIGDVPTPVRWYRRHTDGLTRQHAMWAAVVAFVVWCVLAACGWCSVARELHP